jgi:hypothetical protein
MKELNISDQAWKLVNVGIGGTDLVCPSLVRQLSQLRGIVQELMSSAARAWSVSRTSVHRDCMDTDAQADIDLPFSKRPQQYARDIKEAIDHLRVHARTYPSSQYTQIRHDARCYALPIE